MPSSLFFLLTLTGDGALDRGVRTGAIEFCDRARLAVPLDISQLSTNVIDTASCAGLLTRVVDDATARTLVAMPFPVLNLSTSRAPWDGIGNFGSDDREVGRMAARHLLARGYRSLLGIGVRDRFFSTERLAGFAEVARRARTAVRTEIPSFEFSGERWNPVVYAAQMREVLAPLLSSMPLDTGVFAVNDFVGRLVQSALQTSFPERLHTTGVLGVDNEQTHAWHPGAMPGLSSVEPGFVDMGRAAMRWLADHPGDRRAATGLHRTFPPRRVVERASTAGAACDEPLTAKMARWAWQRVAEGQPLSVTDMAHVHKMSRRSVTRRFTQWLSIDPREFILRLRVDRAKLLLREDAGAIGEISARCGFAKQSTLSEAFRRAEGCTPRDYRAKLRASGGA